MNEFEKATYLAQINRLRKLAIEVVKQYPIKVFSLNFIQYGENATFKIVDTKNKKYLLKLHREIYHSKQSLLEEHKWLLSLSNATTISVPKPVMALNKHSLIDIPNNIAPNFIYGDIFEWVEGRFIWKSIHVDHLKKLGGLMGELQKQGKKLKIHHRHYWHTEGLVGTTNAKLGNVDELLDISKEDQKKISHARKVIYQKLHHFEKANPDKIGLIHADLHFGNFLIQKENVGVIDFDDCGTGFYGYDLIVPIFMLEYLMETQKNKNLPALKEALYAGYSKFMPLTQRDLEMVPYFLSARKLAMLAWLQSRSSNPRLKAKLIKETKRTIKHIARDLDIF
jgi:Ser/Thr protein kinase RdoA (MazF antagonist)